MQIAPTIVMAASLAAIERFENKLSIFGIRRPFDWRYAPRHPAQLVMISGRQVKAESLKN
jgi:hypothetical protein